MANMLFIILFSIHATFAFTLFEDKSFKDLADRMAKKSSAPIVNAERVKKEILKTKSEGKVVIFDARESKEFNVSHLPGAKHVGYNKFNAQKAIKGLSKDQKIIVYCTVGYRSGQVAQKLRRLGYNAHNLHGGITSWVNESGPLVDTKSAPTQKVHTYSKRRAKWFKKGELVN